MSLALSISFSAQAADILHNEETPGGGVIFIVGELKYGDEKHFEVVAHRYNRAAVLFSSPGGNLLAGIQIGRTIRMRNFATGVAPGTMCASACAFAWLGGTKRYMADSARLGFHAVYENRTGVQAESGLGNAVLGAYVTQLALPLSAVVYITKAKPTDMTWLTLNDARRVGIDIETLQVAATKKTPAPASSGPAETANPTDVGQRWIVVGSSADLNKAISVAAKYKPEFRGTTVLRSQNGRFAIALGKFSVDEASALLSDLKAQKKVSDDAYLSAGSRLISIDWQ